MYSIIIIGGGIVGLATAYQLLEANPDLNVIVLEKETEIATHQTSHNSGVIHSGIYYKPGSEKALNCLRGYSMMIDFCEKQSVPYKICGKVIVATKDKEVEGLKKIYKRGNENGLKALKLLDRNQLKEIEPHTEGIQAIWVPQAGIIQYKQVAFKLKTLIESKGGKIICDAQVRSIHRQSQGWVITTTNEVYQANYVITCGGLHADRLARLTDDSFDLKIIPFRGEYYTLRPEVHHLVKTLIYPVPNPSFPFLGVHFTSMISGGVEAGPNAVFALGRESYNWKTFNWSDTKETIAYPGFRKIARKYWWDGLYEMYRSLSKRAFVHALQRLIPEIKAVDLMEGGSGVRAQAIDPEGNIVDDFLFRQGKDILHVVNAPSPAATSSLSIGLSIAEKVLNKK
ncbi:MAG: L-2-hydroxyglutarate oxidase [Saprospiraceae bacterium]